MYHQTHKVVIDGQLYVPARREAGFFKMSAKQARVLNDVLRTLDIRRLYATGDKLRKAFGVELDAVGSHRRDDT